MRARVLTAIIGLPLLFFILSQGGIVLVFGVSFLTFAGVLEYTFAINRDRELRKKISAIFMLILASAISITIKLDYYFLMPMILLIFITIFSYEILSGNIGIQRGSAMLLGLIYVPVMFGYLYLFENLENGSYYLWLIFIIAFSTDTAAYFAGRSFGKRHLAPKISPKKTVAGAIGGIIAASGITIIYGVILGSFYNFVLPWYFYGCIGIIGSIAGQCGDLTASMIKRRVRIKDFGHILPGHGGILDRFDSILFIIPLIYVFATLTANVA